MAVFKKNKPETEGEYIIDMLNRAHSRKVDHPFFEKWMNDNCLINETKEGLYIVGCDIPLDDVLLIGFRLKYLQEMCDEEN
jgi:hypothetical protein